MQEQDLQNKIIAEYTGLLIRWIQTKIAIFQTEHGILYYFNCRLFD